MENKFAKDFEIEITNIKVNPDFIEFKDDEDGTGAKGKGIVVAQIHYLPTDISWPIIYSMDLFGTVKGFITEKPSWNNPGGDDWDSIVWTDCENIEYVNEGDFEGEYPKVLMDSEDNEDFDMAWEAVNDKVQSAIEEYLPFEE